jgi:menaquinone-dependent protoporphyrinogen oxidase
MDPNPGGRILVAYATKYGSTAEIAERIGDQLRGVNLATDTLSASELNDLTPYRAVILGSAVYIGQWRESAARFLKDQEAHLAQRPVWLFSSGPTGTGEPVELMKGWRFPPALQPIADRIRPREIAFFHGNLNPAKLTMVERWIVKSIGAPVGDFRDWKAIDAWAATIASALGQDDPSR